MKKCKEGDTFERLTIVRSGYIKDYVGWWCRCSCGNPNLVLVKEAELRKGHVRSCGCLAMETKSKIGKANIKETFSDWCIQHDRIEWSAQWDHELNVETPDKVGCQSNKDYYFKCKDHPNHKFKAKLVDIYRCNRKFKCPICSSFGYSLIEKYGEDAIEKYWDYDKNDNIDPYMISKSTNKKIFIKCPTNNLHESYDITGSHFWRTDNPCPYCKHKRIIPMESLGFKHPEVLSLWSDKNSKTPFEYFSHSGQNVYWKCNCGVHEDYKRSINESNDSLFICPECKKLDVESNLEKQVKKYLSFKYPCYTLNTEYNCSIVPRNPKTNHKLVYDNELVELKLIIEVHGEQHYHICQFTTFGAKKYNLTEQEVLQYQQWKDEYKRIYALSHGYSYLEIPYYSFNSHNDFQKLIDDKIDSLTKYHKNA